MGIKNRYLFNFAVSYSGGGFKRLYEFAQWFHSTGGASFIIHPNSVSLANEYSNNRYFIEYQPKYQRLLNDCAYLTKIIAETGRPDLYYAYGIPIYARIGAVNWFHLSNVLPLAWRGIPLGWRDRFTMAFLGWQIRKNYRHADVVSAESLCSLELIRTVATSKQFLSVNGSDDELEYVNSGRTDPKEDIACVLGTYRHKALVDSWRVFEMLLQQNDRLKLVVIGHEKYVPPSLRRQQSVILAGLVPRPKAMEFLRKSRYYISTSLIENSYNAASEGVFCADESYITDIGPHRELLANSAFERVSIPKVTRPMLHVRRAGVLATNLRTWHEVISGMIARFESEYFREARRKQ